ncbi:HNH endonuclease [Methanomethylophilus alvi]|uniref:HNH endonuclease n=1 Tax=Methanomethylophilus alvi TaxID=1291540 RepID=UPI0037DDD109
MSDYSDVSEFSEDTTVSEADTAEDAPTECEESADFDGVLPETSESTDETDVPDELVDSSDTTSEDSSEEVTEEIKEETDVQSLDETSEDGEDADSDTDEEIPEDSNDAKGKDASDQTDTISEEDANETIMDIPESGEETEDIPLEDTDASQTDPDIRESYVRDIDDSDELLSDTARNLEGMEWSQSYKDYTSQLAAENSELIKRERELSAEGLSDSEEYQEIRNRLRHNETDLEYLNGNGMNEPLRDYVYKNIEDLEPSTDKYLRKNPELWNGDIGNSLMGTDDEEVSAILKEYGQEGVRYSNNNPDFRPFTKHYSDKFGYFDGEVPIHSMKADRDSFGNEINSRSLNRTADPSKDYVTTSDLGNFAQADLAMAKRLNTTPQEIRAYMKENNLTWHECRDGVTMQMVPTKINGYYKHEGGVSMVYNENLDGAKGIGGVERDYTQIYNRKGDSVIKKK